MNSGISCSLAPTCTASSLATSHTMTGQGSNDPRAIRRITLLINWWAHKPYGCGALVSSLRLARSAPFKQTINHLLFLFSFLFPLKFNGVNRVEPS